jgi:FtsP/CotA-like multicopper oxidase with cupredoxin domain
MTLFDLSRPSRREVLLGAAAGLAATAAPWPIAAAQGVRDITLTVDKTSAPLVGDAGPATPVWAYGGSLPGPEIRARQGDRLRIGVENRLDEPTTVHWHGLRVPHAMDGVPGLTQPAIPPGGSFVYEFDLPDAGTYWYHPHTNTAEQLGRGLSGALIVDEPEPPAVDRDVTWVLDDWRLAEDATIAAGFDNMHDMTHGGRLGNVATVNGQAVADFAMRRGERIRLRLINVANARIMALEFEGHAPTVIALDGQPVAPHAPAKGAVLLGPAMRADIILDASAAPGERFAVNDRAYKGHEYRVLDLVYDETPLRERPPQTPVTLAANTMPEPDLQAASRHRVTFTGGAMGGLASAVLDGQEMDARTLISHGKAWAANGIAAGSAPTDPLVSVGLGQSVVLTLVNETAWPHPFHLHGHSFRVLSRDGEPTEHREWLDTVLLRSEEQAEIAFVADNPGDWLLHCHILSHVWGGMAGIVRVA